MTRAKDISKIVTDANLSGTLDVTGAVTLGNKLSLKASLTNPILFENQHSVTTDASISTFDDANGTLISLGSNFYIDGSGSEQRFNTGEENSAVVLNRTGTVQLKTGSTGATAVDRLKVDSAGDISFYEDTGTTPKLFWDASAERLGIGTSSPSHELTVAGSTDTRVTIDGSNSAGLYISDSGANGITIRNTNDGDLEFLTVGGKEVVFNQLSVDTNFRVESDNQSHMLFVDAGSNEVGIGTSDPRSPLHVSTTHTVTDVTSANTNSTLSIGNTGAGNGVYNAIKFSGNQQDMYIMSFNNATQADRRLGFFVGSTAGDAAADERLSITGDGNVLIGKTAADFSVNGVALQPSGVVGITRDGGVPLILNRKTSDGDIVNFQKSGAVVGSIGTYSGDLTIGDDDVGIRFDTGTGLVPWDLGATTTGGSATNGTIDLGVSGAAFKDLYLSGNANVGDRLLVNGATSNAQLSVKGDASLRAQNVQVAVDGHTAIGFFNTAGTDVGGIAIGTNGASISLGGNSASNTLDDYEEGTWTPTFRDLNGNLATLSTALGSYTKIGRQVILNFNLTLSSKGSMTGDFCLMSNLPFSHPNNSYNGTGHIDKFTNLDTAVSGLSFDISSTTTLMWLMGVAAAGSGSSQYISTSYIGGNEQFKGTCIYYTDD